MFLQLPGKKGKKGKKEEALGGCDSQARPWSHPSFRFLPSREFPLHQLRLACSVDSCGLQPHLKAVIKLHLDPAAEQPSDEFPAAASRTQIDTGSAESG